MSVRIIANSLSEKLGSSFANLFTPIVPFITDFACDLWQQYPDRITNNQNLRTSFQRGFMTNLCGTKQPLPPTTSTGCEPDLFVYGTYYQKNATTGGCNRTGYWRNKIGIPQDNIASLDVDTSTSFVAIVGQDGTRYELRSLSKELYDERNIGSSSSGPSIKFVDRSSPCLTTTNQRGGDDFERTDQIMLYPTDPACDDQPQYPVTNPPPVITKKTTLIYDNDTYIDLELNVNTDPDGNISFPIVFANGEISLTLDIGGITINNGSDVPTTSLPVIEEEPAPDVTIKRPYLTDPDIVVDEKTDEDDKQEEVGEQLRFVEVILDSIPQNASSQWGDDGPNIYYAGWFEFQADGRNFPRRPIHFQLNIFDAPEGATGYAYTLYQGFTGRANVYTIDET